MSSNESTERNRGIMSSNESTDLQPFSFEDHPVRIVLDENGEPWWAAKDVAEALGYATGCAIASLADKVPGEWKGIKRFDTLGGSLEV